MDPSGPSHSARRLAEGLTAAALVVVPLYFTVFTGRVFEGDKAALLRWLGLGAAFSLLIAVLRDRVRGGDPRPAGEGLALGGLGWPRLLPWMLGAALGAEALSTAVGVAPWTSLLGSQTRGQGLWTSLALAGIAGGAAGLAGRPGGADRLARLLGIGALPAGLYALAQGLGLDPLPWERPVMSRVAGPAGAAPMLAAQLVLALPFAAVAARAAWDRQRLRPSRAAALGLAAWLIALAAGGAALALSASRGPILGLAAGLWLLALAACARRGGRRARRTAAALLLGAVLGMGFLVALNRGALPRLAELPLLDRLSTALNPERNSTRARLRLWEGSILSLGDLAQLPDRQPPARPLPPSWRLLLGYGPESMHLTWAPTYPPLLAYDEPRGYMPDRAHSLFLDALLTGGLLGAIGQLLLLALGLYAALSVCLARGLGSGETGMGAFAYFPFFSRLGRREGGERAAPDLLPFSLLPLALAPVLAFLVLRLDGPWCLARSPWPAGACLLAPVLGLGLLAGLGLSLAMTSWRDGTGLLRLDAATAVGRAAPVAVPDAAFGAAALVALAAHAFELQVSFSTVAGRMALWAVLGGLVGLGRRGPGRAREAHSGPHGYAGASAHSAADLLHGDETASQATDDEAGLAAGLVGLTLAFSLARPGQAPGGPLVAAGLVALGAGLTWLAFRPVQAAGGAGPARLALGLGAYTLLHLSLLDGLAKGAADAVPAAGASLLLYVALLLALVFLAARSTQAGRPTGSQPLAWGGSCLLLFLLALPSLAPSMADAWFKEAEQGWQAPVSGLRRDGEGGKAESYLERALARYGRARVLAPWEPAYALAAARARVEWADLLEARRREAEGPAAASWEAARDAQVAAALADIDRAEALAPGAPQPPMTRARALRLWGQWTTPGPLRAERLAAASAAYGAVIARVPGWPELQDEAAQTALVAGRPEEALALALDVALRKDAFYRQAWRTAALAYESLGQPGLASAAYGAYFVDPRNSGDLEGHRAWARVLAAEGKLRSALAQAELVLRLAPGEAAVHADLGALQAATGDLAAARASARRALAINPEDAAIQALVERLDAGD